MLVPEAPWWYLNPTYLAFGKWGGVFLQDTETVPLVLKIKIVREAVPCTQGPQEYRKGAWALRRALLKNDIKYMRNVFCMTDQKPVSFNLRILPMHTLSVSHNQIRDRFYSAVRAEDPYYQPLMVR